MLILKQNAANAVPTPPAGKGTIFLDDSDTLSVKTSDGNVETFPTVAASNAQVVFINGTALSGEAALTYDFNNNVLNISGNVTAGNVLTNNLLYANGLPWDLSDPGGSNTQIQFNDDESFGGSAAFTFNKSTNVVAVSTTFLAGADATAGNFTNATLIASKGDTGATDSARQAVVGEALASAVDAIGVQGIGKTAGAFKGTGLQGLATVSATGDTGAAVGVRGYANATHVGGYNIGVLGNASGSGLGNYAFYVQAGNIGSIETDTAWDLNDNSATSLAFNSSGKANILRISTVDGSEGVAMSGTLDVTGNISVGGIKTNNYYYANGSPVDFQQAGGSNTQIQFNDADGFGGSAAFTFNKTSNVVTMSGNLSVANIQASGDITTATLTSNGNANVGNLGTAGLVTATGNVTGGNLTTAGVVAATGNVSGGNINTAGKVVASTLESNVATGTAPFTVASTTKVTNLNADLLDGYSTDTASTANTVVVRDANGNFSANVVTANLSGAATTAGTVTTAAQPNITSVGTLTGLSVDGSNISLANGVYTGNGSGLSALAGGNVTGQVGNALVAGTVYTAAQPNITSVGSLTSLTVTGNASAGNISTGGILSVTGNASAGNVAGGNLVTANYLAGTLTTAAQPNITSVGTLSSLTVTGTATAGNLSTGGTLSVTGNANVGNLGTAGLITATGNVSGGNLTTGGVVAATGNVSGGNLTTAGALSVTGNANTGNLGTTTLIATTGNITTINSGLLQNGNSNIAITADGNVSIQAAGSTVELVVTSTGANISGTLNATGNANVGNIGATNGVFTNVSGNGAALTALPGGNVTGQVANALVAGTVYTAAQPIITSVGTLTGLTMGGNIAMGNYWVTGLNSPVASTDAATKQYVDDVAQGLHTHDSCNAATDGTLATISGGTVTYNNGSSGVGATLTTTGSYTTIDGVTLQNGMRILVKNEANAAHNGIYDRTSSTVLTRSTDFDTSTEMAGGDFTFVTAGTLYDNTGWVMTDPVTTVGTTAVNWVQFSGAGTYTAGTGLTLTGTVFSVNASQTQITSVGTLGSLTVSGNASAGNLSTGGALSVTGNANVGNIGAAAGVFTSVSGNGSALTALNASNISTGTLAQARLANSTLTLGNTTLTLGATTTTVAGLTSVTSTTFVGALTGAATTAGTVTTAAQPNITSVGTLSSLSVTGNGSFGNVSATTFTGALSGAATTAGTVTTAAQPNITSVGTLTGLGVNGNITAANITANTGVFTGNGSGLSALAGANVTGTVSSATTAGTVTTAAQPNITSVGTLSSLSVTGNGSFGNVSATTFTGALSGAATTAGTVTTAAQPNITSVGTLTGLTLAANADITMSGTGSNINGVALVSATLFEGSGANLTTLNGSNISSGTIAQARLANASVTLGSTALTLGSTVTTVAGLSSVTSTTFVGALTGAATTAGTVTTAAQPNITSVGTLTSLTTSGDIVCGGYFDASVNAAVSAAGTVQGNATAIASQVNVVSTVASGAGVVLPTAVAGYRITLINTAANACLVYPATGGQINALGTNAAYSLPAGGRLDYQAVSTTQWYTLNATYG